MEKLTTLNFNEKTGKGLVLVDFYADWCGPCKMMGPVLEEIDHEMEEVTIYKLNVDEQGAIAQQFGVMSIPTLILFKDGVKVNQTVGFSPKPLLQEFIKKGL